MNYFRILLISLCYLLVAVNSASAATATYPLEAPPSHFIGKKDDSLKDFSPI